MAAFAIFFMASTTAADVGMRLILGRGTNWTLEFARYALVAQIFFGLAYTLKERSHIRITFFTSRLPAKAQEWLVAVSSFLFLIYTSILFYYKWQFFKISLESKTTSLTIVVVTVWPFQLFMPVGLAIISLLLIHNIYNEVRIALGNRRSPNKDTDEEVIV